MDTDTVCVGEMRACAGGWEGVGERSMEKKDTYVILYVILKQRIVLKV